MSVIARIFLKSGKGGVNLIVFDLYRRAPGYGLL